MPAPQLICAGAGFFGVGFLASVFAGAADAVVGAVAAGVAAVAAGVVDAADGVADGAPVLAAPVEGEVAEVGAVLEGVEGVVGAASLDGVAVVVAGALTSVGGCLGAGSEPPHATSAVLVPIAARTAAKFWNESWFITSSPGGR